MFDKEAEERARKLEEKQTLGVYDNDEDLARDEGFNEGEVVGYEQGFKDGAELGYNKALKEIWHYPLKGEYPEKGKEILLYTKTLGLIFGEFCKGYNNLWTSNRCDFTTEEIIAWIEKEEILPKGE